jgi:hypothetical protein
VVTPQIFTRTIAVVYWKPADASQLIEGRPSPSVPSPM